MVFVASACLPPKSMLFGRKRGIFRQKPRAAIDALVQQVPAILADPQGAKVELELPEVPATSQYVAHDETMETATDAGPGSPKQTLLVGEECNTTGGHSSGRPIWIR